MTSLPILYQDKYLVAVNKPSGLLTHRSDIDRHATENAMTTARNQLRQWVYPVHRLDRATSGVLVFALDRETARRMTAFFTDDAVVKEYLAVVRGFTEEVGRIDHPLKERRDRMTDQLADKNKPAQPATSDYRRLAAVELPCPVGRYVTARYSLVAVRPLSGRNHQIRRHMKHIFHPVVGDTTYGDGKQNDFFRKRFNCRRLLLHASRIAFAHPYSGQQVEIQALPDGIFNTVLELFKWQGSAGGT